MLTCRADLAHPLSVLSAGSASPCVPVPPAGGLSFGPKPMFIAASSAAALLARVELLGAGSDRATRLRAVVAVDVRHAASLISELLLQREELDLGRVQPEQKPGLGRRVRRLQRWSSSSSMPPIRYGLYYYSTESVLYRVAKSTLQELRPRNSAGENGQKKARLARSRAFFPA